MKINPSGKSSASWPVQPDPLTLEQKQNLTEILSRFTPENFTGNDRPALLAMLQEADIPKTMEVDRIIREKGLPISITQTAQAPDRRTLRNPDQPLVTPEIISLFRQRGAGLLTEEEFFTRLDEFRQRFSKMSGNLLNKTV